eukprot:129831_1
MATKMQLLSIVLMFYHAIAQDGDFSCWPESERTSLRFANTNNSIDHLPTIRFIQGYWDSQWALQYIGYLYLKEKMGLNVEFFPKLSSGLSLDNLSPYPDFYWQSIADDEYDLLLEMWQTVDMESYYDEGSVIYGGINEIYGQIGTFVPDFVYDEQITATLPKELKYNTAFRTQFMEAYTNNSNKDWVKWLNDTLYSDNETLSTYLKMNYSLPTYDRPIMWGSSMTYTMSTYLADVNRYFEIWNDSSPGLDWDFCPLLSEATLSEFIIDLYENHEPFIVNIYTPHPDFATVSARTGEFIEWEPIFLRRNPDNSRSAECYSVTHQCHEPLQALFKLGNPKLGEDVPEVLAFLYGFNLLAEHLADIIYHRKLLDDVDSMTSHEKWLNATCRWLRSNEAVMSKLNADIIRYDCPDGCGYDGVGGYCANSSTAPQCICTNQHLTGEHCRTHCDGLVFDDGNFTACSGNGVCDISRQKCTCFEGYNGEGCEVVFSAFEYNPSLQALFVAVLLLYIVILTASIVWLWMNQKYKTVKALSPKMTSLFTVGLILLCVGAIIYLFHPLTNISCNLRNFCYGLGAILTIMAPLCKTYRVSIIFAQARQMKRIEISDAKLLIYLINGMIIEFCICCVYTVLHEMNGGVDTIYLPQYDRIESVCNQSKAVTYIESANYLYIFTLIIVLCFFSFKNRKSHKLFKESKCAFFGSFFSLFVFIVVLVFNIVVDDRDIIVTIQAAAMLCAVSVIWALFYGVRLYRFAKYPEKRSEVDLSSKKSATGKSADLVHMSPPQPSMQTRTTESTAGEGTRVPVGSTSQFRDKKDDSEVP